VRGVGKDREGWEGQGMGGMTVILCNCSTYSI
jgi:hypothetical protein